MPLVYIHGVGTRSSDKYYRRERIRNELFRRFLLRSQIQPDGSPTPIFSPYWGNLGSRLTAGGISSPRPGLEVLGGGQFTPNSPVNLWFEPKAPLGHAGVGGLVGVAQRSLEEAIDLLFDALADGDAEPELLADFAERATRHANEQITPSWLSQVRDDGDLIDRLLGAPLRSGTAAPGKWSGNELEWETLGGSALRSKLTESAFQVRLKLERARDVASDAVPGQLVSRVRRLLLPSVTGFLGDAMVYLSRPGTAGSIGVLVADALRKAARLTVPDDILVVVAHSMGANIAYDLLTTELTDINVDLLITAGTQVGLFEELNLFRYGVRTGSGETPRKRPANISRWLNVLDLNDPLGFVVAPIIEGVEDYSFGTGAFLGAHGGYLTNPSFHGRLLARTRTGAL